MIWGYPYFWKHPCRSSSKNVQKTPAFFRWWESSFKSPTKNQCETCESVFVEIAGTLSQISRWSQLCNRRTSPQRQWQPHSRSIGWFNMGSSSTTIQKACSTAFVAIEDIVDLRPNGSIHPQCEKMTHARKCTNGIVMIYAPSIEIWTKDSFPQIYKYTVLFSLDKHQVLPSSLS